MRQCTLGTGVWHHAWLHRARRDRISHARFVEWRFGWAREWRPLGQDSKSCSGKGAGSGREIRRHLQGRLFGVHAQPLSAGNWHTNAALDVAKGLPYPRLCDRSGCLAYTLAPVFVRGVPAMPPCGYRPAAVDGVRAFLNDNLDYFVELYSRRGCSIEEALASEHREIASIRAGRRGGAWSAKVVEVNQLFYDRLAARAPSTWE